VFCIKHTGPSGHSHPIFIEIFKIQEGLQLFLIMQALLRRSCLVQQPLSLLAFKPQEVFITTATSSRGLEDLIPKILKPDEPVVHSGMY
jgi:hypothetical protein